MKKRTKLSLETEAFLPVLASNGADVVRILAVTPLAVTLNEERARLALDGCPIRKKQVKTMIGIIGCQ